MNRRMRISVMALIGSLVVLIGMSVLPPAAAAEEGPEVYVTVESFTWQEYDEMGVRLLKESGPRAGAGFAYRRVFENMMTLKPRLEIVGGSVDYDGATQAGVPTKSETDYLSFKGEMDLGGQMGERVIIEPFAGLGFRSWSREINDSITVAGTRSVGYTENWTMSYWRFGFRLLTPPDEARRGYFELGVRVPIATENTALLSEKFLAEDVTFEPGNKTSFFSEGGFRTGRFKASLFYETLRFTDSPVELERFSMLLLYQPRSEADIYGIRLGAAF